MAVQDKNRQFEILEKVFCDHYQELLSFAWKLAGDYQTAKDMVQDVFATAINNPSLVPLNTTDATRYLYTSVKNRVTDYIRHMNIRENNSQLLAESLIFSGTDSMESDPDLINTIKGCMDRLPSTQREVIRLKFTKNLTYKEISDVLQIAVSTIHTHVKRSYLFLRLCIGKKVKNMSPESNIHTL